MLASARAPTGDRVRAPPTRFGVGEVGLLPDAVAQHRLPLPELAGRPALRHPHGPETAAVEAKGMHGRLDGWLPGRRDRSCPEGLRRRHGPFAECPTPPLRNHLAGRSFHLQSEQFRPALQEPERPRLLPQPRALVPVLTRVSQPRFEVFAQRPAIEVGTTHVAAEAPCKGGAITRTRVLAVDHTVANPVVQDLPRALPNSSPAERLNGGPCGLQSFVSVSARPKLDHEKDHEQSCNRSGDTDLPHRVTLRNSR
jgi:hypothetical protein